MRSPKASEGQGGALGEAEALKRGNTVGVRDQVMDLVASQGLRVSRSESNVKNDEPILLPIAASLLPTPVVNDMGAGKTVEAWDDWTARIKKKHNNGNGHGASLNIEMLRLLPTPTIQASLLPTPRANEPGSTSVGYGDGLNDVASRIVHGYAKKDRNVEMLRLLPTPAARDHKDGSAPHERGGLVQTDTVARAVFNSGEIDLLGTPRANAATATTRQIEAGAPKGRIEDQVLTTSWGKFEPAIRRWEEITGRPAPAPTLPDGKDGAHRLSPWFTEWMMGLPNGWICDETIGLKRNMQLKAAGNGVVPQQAHLALQILGIQEILKVQ